MTPPSVRVVSWNLHGIPFVRNRSSRILRAVLEALHRKPDFVLLQELWFANDVRRVATVAHDHGYEPCATIRRWPGRQEGGLLSLVRRTWTVRQAAFTRFRSKGPAWRLWEGDGVGNKGFQVLSVAHTETAALATLVNTHLQAQYGPTRPYRNVRRQQLEELVKGSALDIPAEPLTSSSVSLPRFARRTVVRWSQRVQNSRSGPHNGLVGQVPLTAPTSCSAILGGDLNTTPHESSLIDMLVGAGWRDATESFRRASGCGTHLTPPGEWLDYVMTRTPDGQEVTSAVELIENRTTDDPYSDHHGLQVDLQFQMGSGVI